MSEKKDIYTVYLAYSETGQTIRDDFDSSDWSGYSEYQKTVTPLYFSINQPKHHHFETLELDFNPNNSTALLLVFPTYSDGGTFGCTHGYPCFGPGYVYPLDRKEEAKDLQNKLYSQDYENVVLKLQPFKRFDDKKQSIYSIPWYGYFSSLDDVALLELPLHR